MEYLKKLYERVTASKPAVDDVTNADNPNENKSRFRVFLPGIILGVVVLIAAGSVTLTLALRRQGRDIFSPSHQMQVFFFSPSEGRLQSENRPWPYGNQHDWVSAAIGHLRFPPNSNRLISTWPNINPLIGVEETPFLLSFRMHESTLIANFYDSYLEMPPLQEALFRSAFTLTMVGSSFIDEVIIRVNGNEWIESAATIANSPDISHAQIINTQLALYFIDETGEGLVREYYNAVGIDAQRRAQVALERLIEGTAEDGAFSVIPPETRILAVIHVIETSSTYVNLSGDFLRLGGGPAQTQLMIAAIVNTVIENSMQDVRQVFFLIDSSREQLPGIDDFTLGFEYDETVMFGFVPEYEYEEGATE